MAKFTTGDRDVFVSANAVWGADFWMDPMIDQVWLAGERAAKILISLNLQQPFQLNQCKFPDTETSLPT
ncbi:hypothetical protein ABMC89_14960 [Sulfitobacter sp. HNIBRBA3233]|uniref:hypothetical protein n=1 Tax=Sulfitobacter marinivivus TaxID=3158558 RepID=UPI0032DF4787